MRQVLGANESTYNIIEEQLPCYDFQLTVLFPAFHVGQLTIVPILNGIEAHFWHFLFQINQSTTEKEFF